MPGPAKQAVVTTNTKGTAWCGQAQQEKEALEPRDANDREMTARRDSRKDGTTVHTAWCRADSAHLVPFVHSVVRTEVWGVVYDHLGPHALIQHSAAVS